MRTVPEWISRIREQLSVSYAGLGMKYASDYNRNIYLDILNYTRQDKELESRYLSLEADSRQMTLVLSLVIVGLVLVVILWWFSINGLNKESGRRGASATDSDSLPGYNFVHSDECSINSTRYRSIIWERTSSTGNSGGRKSGTGSSASVEP